MGDSEEMKKLAIEIVGGKARTYVGGAKILATHVLAACEAIEKLEEKIEGPRACACCGQQEDPERFMSTVSTCAACTVEDDGTIEKLTAQLDAAHKKNEELAMQLLKATVIA